MLKIESTIDKISKQIKTIVEGLGTFKTKIKQCYSDNPLQIRDKNKEETRLEMIDKNKIIRVNAVRYGLRDQEEFKKQSDELEKLKIIRQNRSPHSLLAFMVRNHAKIIRGKPKMVVNYKKLDFFFIRRQQLT